jgi:biopolymer transport protein ExbB
MLDKRTTPLLAAIGAVALLALSAPAMAQAPAASNSTTTTTTSTDAAAPAPAAADSSAPGQGAAKKSSHGAVQMFIDATPVPKTVMIGLLLASVFTWTLLIIKIFEFSKLNRDTSKFLEEFRGARSIADINRISTQEEFEGNPMADMAAAASGEVELSRQAGLSVSGENRGSTIDRANAAVAAVQAGLGRRLSSGMQFLASVGSSGPFIGLFGTVYGIMNSFIGIADTGTTNLAAVAPGIAEALLATGIGLFAAIPSVIFYNYFQTRISAYGSRTEGFVAELMNAISRQLDKGV